MKFEIRDGCFSYQKNAAEKDYILSHINFAAGEGDLIAVLGPNGIGKTTLLRCMMGFLEWQKGQSLLDGRDIRDIPCREFWQKVAYVPQAKRTVTAYTAEEMVLLGRSSHFGFFAKPSDTDISIAHEAIKRLHIEKLSKKKCTQLSGGELQMVLIARALAAEPSLLILDEPESNLDFRNQLIILDVLCSLSSQGISCIFNTHYPGHALQRANKSLLLNWQGRTIFGDTCEVITEENIESAFGVKSMIGEFAAGNEILKEVLPLKVI